MIMVTGASGTVGREVVARLVPLASVRLLTRSPACLAPPAPGVEVVVGDFSDPVRLATAFAGVRAVFVVTADPLRPDHDANIIDVALACGVRHVVKLSALAVADPAADDLITRWQRANEERLLASGLDWTLLRPRAFMSNTLAWAGQIRESGVVRGLGRDGRNSCVDPRDIAQVAVRALTRTGHEGKTYALTGPQGLSPADQVAEISAVLGREIRFEEVSQDQARQALLVRYPAPVADALMESARRTAAGAKSGIESGVAEVLGRPAGTFRQWAEDHRHAFTGGQAVLPGGALGNRVGPV
ncbi:nucleotide-diphosphate-sugar epimerase [Streptomyces coeruleorubidus]|uniref:SDR family oxidoreductase n=2 Tax=Streptomyces coeruleorubidus TaxID=116188 RepID=A0A5J6IK23_STRC4|nr:SDR family oxidoreductase [Streptomyces coeruleorubidus]QEV28945.1 SDR family oxidoreductase [Streptomyces coeruleorubidus]GGU12497.1 nucleotide-diphosphate-sugar epimerase [Streptomyces coeruleorubidus]